MPEVSRFFGIIMLKDIITVKPCGEYRLHLQFEDGVEGEINVAELIEFCGVFAPLRDPTYFAQVRVNPELGTITWPNEADLDSDVLYSILIGEPLPTFELA
jgi:Protein of unknown function (DUF2442)